MFGDFISHPIFLGSFALFSSFTGATLTFPFLQTQRDKLGCDALCYGSMQSVRSGLSLLGTIVIGRLSDKYGRWPLLLLGTCSSLISLIINLMFPTLSSMWITLIISALCNQNFCVMKAYFADISEEAQYTETQRASAMGKLGMAAGISFMTGPLLAATLMSSYDQAMIWAIVCTIFSLFLLSFLPTKLTINKDKKTKNKTTTKVPSNNNNQNQSLSSMISSFQQYCHQLISLQVLQFPGSWLLLILRGLMGLAFHIFMVIWTISLKTRFEFTPRDHALFMSWIGLWYSLSQGIVSQYLIGLCGSDSTPLLLICMVILGLGRYLAMVSTSMMFVYGYMMLVIIALGVVNTTISSASIRLCSSNSNNSNNSNHSHQKTVEVEAIPLSVSPVTSAASLSSSPSPLSVVVAETVVAEEEIPLSKKSTESETDSASSSSILPSKATATKKKGDDEVGGLFGLLEAVESAAGIIGPMVSAKP
jgi:MFS family permease